MRALVVSIWVFINLVFFGMCGYMYLLWSQYWMYMERQTEATTSIYDQQIYFYNRGYYPSEVSSNKTVHYLVPEVKPRKKHSIFKENSTVTLIKNSKPRYVSERVFRPYLMAFMCVSGFQTYSLKILNSIPENITVWTAMRNSTVI